MPHEFRLVAVVGRYQAARAGAHVTQLLDDIMDPVPVGTVVRTWDSDTHEWLSFVAVSGIDSDVQRKAAAAFMASFPEEIERVPRARSQGRRSRP